MSTQPKIRVRSKHLLQAPLLESNDVGVVEIRDSFGDLMALLTNLKDDMWSLCTRDSEDWHTTLVRYGYADYGNSGAREIISGQAEPIVK